MELSQIEQFVTIVKCGTLSKAAEELFISQPALSRSMQKFEQELGVPLFSHGKNRIELNENGKFALSLCEDILKSTTNFAEQVRQFDRVNRTVAVASCAPAPLWEILPFLSSLYPEKRLTSEVAENDKLFEGLKAGTYQIIISTEEANDPNVVSVLAGKEALLLNVPKIHPLAKKKGGVRFSEIEKYSVLLYAHTGIWENIIREQMPAAHVIMQENRDSFEALQRESALLSFSTELSARHYGGGENAIQIPITDESATLTFYCHILKKNKAALKEFIEKYQ